jgi:hypothetical protein
VGGCAGLDYHFDIVFGWAVVAWLIGYGTGYRRGVNGAINGSVRKSDHRLNEE